MRLEALLERCGPSGGNGARPPTGLDWAADWAGMLSLGEQQRLAFARYGASPMYPPHTAKILSSLIK